MSTKTWIGSCALALALGSLPGCECSDPDPVGCTGSDECATGETCRDGVCEAILDGGGADSGQMDGGQGVDAGPPRTLVSIAIDPAAATLTAGPGEMPEQDFDVIGTYSDGSMAEVPGPTFSIDDDTLGFLDPASGRFTANGVIGGETQIHVTVPGPTGELGADATLIVNLEREILGEGVDGTVPPLFGGTPTDDPARNPGLVYPLDGAVMPQNVFPADIQWVVGTVGDWVEVTLVKPHVTATMYLADDGNHHWLADSDAWRSVVQSDPEEPAVVTVTRYELATGDLLRGESVSVTFARAALTGSVYYWNISEQVIVRINDGTGVGESFMPTPPNSADGGQNCVGCHSVSNNGRYMAGRLGPGQNIGGVFDLTTDLTADPAPTVFPLASAPRSLEWWFSSWNPDDTRIVVVNDDGSAARSLHFYDPYAGVEVPVTGTLPAGTHPAWSPDGNTIAYVANPDTWGGHNTTGDIATVDVTGVDALGPTRVVHTAASVTGSTCDSYPTWSPDSMHLAFANGSGSRSEDALAALYLMRPDGTNVVRLDAANGGAATTDNFQPNFSPFETGGYYWLSFLSRRDYGNAQVGTAATAGFQQIWITAIRVGAADGEDPSSVPYWLPGQRLPEQVGHSRNISAFWAPRACRPDGEECSVGSECCGGECLPGAGGVLVCSPPPPDRCREEGETCTSNGDCCPDMSLSCLGNVCVRAPI